MCTLVSTHTYVGTCEHILKHACIHLSVEGHVSLTGVPGQQLGLSGRQPGRQSLGQVPPAESGGNLEHPPPSQYTGACRSDSWRGSFLWE